MPRSDEARAAELRELLGRYSYEYHVLDDTLFVRPGLSMKEPANYLPSPMENF